MRAWLAVLLLASGTQSMGCSALVSSEASDPTCEQEPGGDNPCGDGMLCMGTVQGDGILVGTCRSGGREICDGLDNDGNGIIDDDPTYDADGDGYTWCGSGNPARIDCNDGNPNVHPYDSLTMLPVEVCDGLDNDCNGVVDDPARACPADRFCSTARRCYAHGDCSVPEGACVDSEFCDMTLSTPHCATTPSGGCLHDASLCTATQRCNGATNTCEALLPLGDPCAVDSDCATGACFDVAALSYDGTGAGRVCSAPCCADKDCTTSGARCLVTAHGARGCVPTMNDDRPGACGSDGDCDTGDVCHAYSNVMTGGQSRLRTVCAPGEVVQPTRCHQFTCFDGYNACLECDSLTCLSNGCAEYCPSGPSDCYAGICLQQLCHNPCRTNADCPAEERCGLFLHGADRIQVCLFRQDNLRATGTTCTTATQCVDNYCSPSGVCSAECCTDNDCGGGVCRPVNNGGWEMRCLTAADGPS